MSAFTREKSNNNTKPRSQPKLEWTWNTFWFSNTYSWFIPFAKVDQPSQEDSFWVSDIPKRCTRQLIYKIFKDERIIATWHGGSNLGFWAKAEKQMFRFKVDLQFRLLAQTYHKTVTFGCWSHLRGPIIWPSKEVFTIQDAASPFLVTIQTNLAAYVCVTQSFLPPLRAVGENIWFECDDKLLVSEQQHPISMEERGKIPRQAFEYHLVHFAHWKWHANAPDGHCLVEGYMCTGLHQ